MKKLVYNVTKQKYPGRVWSVSFAVLVLAFYYVYFLLRIDPRLIYQSQEPAWFGKIIKATFDPKADAATERRTEETPHQPALHN